MRTIRRAAARFALGVALIATVQAAEPPQHEPVAFTVRELTRGLAHPWSLAFLPTGDLLISERTGGLRRFADGRLEPEPIAGVPRAYAAGDGGYLGLAVHPDFSRTRWLYLCMSTGSDAANATTVIRGRLKSRSLSEVEVIFGARPFKAKSSHFGCRLLFARDRTLLITLGDGYDYRDAAQALDSDLGKIVRVSDDGSIPADNPFVQRAGVRAEIYTLGHRNVQGIALRPGSGEIWSHEHGPRGGDEVNVLAPGANYGWPRTTYGVDYSGEIISELTEAPGITAPRLHWTPSIAPSGMTFYDGAAFPAWRGHVFVGALAARELRRLDLDSTGGIVAEYELLAERDERIRDVTVGPDGYVYVLTDSADGALLRLEPRE
jgi:glucose/arabinose dehydrogenase